MGGRDYDRTEDVESGVYQALEEFLDDKGLTEFMDDAALMAVKLWTFFISVSPDSDYKGRDRDSVGIARRIFAEVRRQRIAEDSNE